MNYLAYIFSRYLAVLTAPSLAPRTGAERDPCWLVEARQRTLNNRIFEKSAITQSHRRRDVAVAFRRINRDGVEMGGPRH
jgi:hypothetical protein